MEKNLTLVKCPNCGKEFSAESAIENELRLQMQKELQLKLNLQNDQYQKQLAEIDTEKQKINQWKIDEREKFNKKIEEEKLKIEEHTKKKVADDFEAQMKSLQKENDEKNTKLKDFQKRELDFMQKERLFKEQCDQMEMEMQKKLNEREEEIKKNAERIAEQRADVQLKQKELELKRRQEELEIELQRKVSDATERVREEEKMKLAEIKKQMEDQKHMIEEMRKKSEQGSMQLQGEVQELGLESLLKATFIYDRIEEVGKGIKGADCIQVVMNTMGQECGKIIYESKRTKIFSHEWIMKLKGDMRNTKADIAVIVTEALPKELIRFGQIEGVWVCTFAEVKSVAFVLRDSLIRVSQAMLSQENKGDKMQLLYDYLTGNEFRQVVEGIVEAFGTLQDDLLRERKALMTLWDKRQKQIDKVMHNTLAMYGSVKGIAGGAVQEIKGLQLDDEEKLLL